MCLKLNKKVIGASHLDGLLIIHPLLKKSCHVAAMDLGSRWLIHMKTLLLDPVVSDPHIIVFHGTNEIQNILKKKYSKTWSEVKWKSLSCVWLFVIPWSIQSMEFSRPEYWGEYPFPSPVDLPNQGSNPGLLHCRQILYQLSYQGSPMSFKENIFL